MMILEEKELQKFILIGDKVLIKPKTAESRTRTGLYLPPTVQEKEKVQSGYVVKTGPGYPIPAMTEIEEAWKPKQEEVRYLPLQAKAGDLAVFLQDAGFEIEFNNEKYLIVPHSSILILIRDEGLFE